MAKDPKHLHARFCLGMYYQHVGNMEKTLECFQAVYEGDPDDLYVGYKYAEALRNVGRQQEAIPVLEKVVERDPGFVSAVYQLATMYTRAVETRPSAAAVQTIREAERHRVDGRQFCGPGKLWHGRQVLSRVRRG